MTAQELPKKMEILVDDDEDVLEVVETHKSPALLKGALGTLVVFGFLGVIVGGIAAAVLESALVGVALFALVVVAFEVWTVLNVFVGSSTNAVTEDMVIHHSDKLGESDMEYLEFDDAKTVDVSEGVLDSLFDTGTVEVEAYEADDITLAHVDEPYDLAKTIRNRI